MKLTPLVVMTLLPVVFTDVAAPADSFSDRSEQYLRGMPTLELTNLPNEQRRADRILHTEGNGPVDLFAELFASLFSASPTKEQTRLAQFFPQTRAKIQQLASLISFTQDNTDVAIPALSRAGSEDNDDGLMVRRIGSNL